MSERLWKAISALLTAIAIGCVVVASITFGQVNEHSTFAAVFGLPGLGAFALVGAIAAWDRSLPRPGRWLIPRERN